MAASTFIQRVRGDYEYSTLERYLLDKVPDVLAERNVGGKPYSGDDNALYCLCQRQLGVNRNLTLNLGLRYEFTSVPQSMKEFALNSVASVPGVLTFVAPQPQKKNFAPRVGFAYSPGSSATTSIRGGFGIAYDQIFDNVGTNARPPQATSTVDSLVTERPATWRTAAFCPPRLRPTRPSRTCAPPRRPSWATSSTAIRSTGTSASSTSSIRTTRWRSAISATAACICSSRSSSTAPRSSRRRTTCRLTCSAVAGARSTALPLTLAGLTAEKNSGDRQSVSCLTASAARSPPTCRAATRSTTAWRWN